MIDAVKIGEGITVGVKKTIAAPDGTRVKSFGVKLVPGGVAVGMQTVDKKGKVTDYAATIDGQSLMQLGLAANLLAYKVKQALRK